MRRPVLVEPPRPTDLDDVAALSVRCFERGWSADELLAEMDRAGSDLWVARLDERVVGYAVARFVVDEGELLSLATDPEMRRHGVGRALLARVLASAEGRRVRALFLEVRADNHAARALYEDAGLRPHEVRSRYYADGEDAVIMAWTAGP